MKSITFERKNNVAVIALNRPPINAFDREMYRELDAAFQMAEEDSEVLSVLLCSANERFFSTGNDIKDFAALAGGDRAECEDYVAAVTTGGSAVFRCSKPVVCACNGVAVGAGFFCVMGADIIYSVENASFGLPEVKMGVVGGTPEASYCMPQNLLKYMMLTGDTVPASELYRLGVIHEIVSPEELMDKAFAMAEKLAKLPPIAVRFTKQSIKNSLRLNDILSEFAPYDRARTLEHSYHPDFKEAAVAFMQKREPHFTGR